MEAKKIIYENTMFLLGMDFYGDPFSNHAFWDENNEIGRLWNRFETFLSKYPEQIKNRIKKNVSLEVFITTEESMKIGIYEVFVGVLVEKIGYIPLNCVAKQLPASKYAVFTLKGNEINSDWQNQIYNKWLPDSGYESPYNYNIQYYDERFKGMDQIKESAVDIYIPVRKKP
ncbi:hypothetical protein GM661_01100 [Iocasia frigidifontis]|uniref:AraC effector-binding domain-containing protein n=1 Tax=Iocasia fonsfrigidae TaxID=2682810 RepID=A0A8A7KCQ2_9FIRM|nr:MULTISPECIES: GyrI-like domain-containing protein [Halanaerobiaceae]AZO93721.1 AraC family transcriptional regulator [Halocella sp. SP3-1]MTI58941.1 GyrI-like domain-containing protein [Bacillota bacterium]QTL96667.1 hypothetical protein GM661_01100 [Iocasia fonsfrigidae]